MTTRTKTPHPILIAAASVVITSGLISIGHAVSREDQTRPSVSAPVHHATGKDAFAQANAKMHEAMSTPATGDVDRDFATGMIAHHQGAVEMARIELEKGSDPQMRRLAESIIASQNQEIEHMRQWLSSDAGEDAPGHGPRHR